MDPVELVKAAGKAEGVAALGVLAPEFRQEMRDQAAALREAAKALEDQGRLREALQERVLRTPEPTPKQEALMKQFADEMPVWAQLSFVQSEVERMRDEVRKALAGGPDAA